MEHRAELTRPQPWRAAAIAAATIATIELFILVFLGLVFGAKLLADEAEKGTTVAALFPKAAAPQPAGGEPAATTATPKEAVAALPRSETAVLVLNGNGIHGAAAAFAERVRALHYLVAGTGNAKRTDFRRSLVMYRPGRRPEAIRLAKDLRIKHVAPLDGLKARDLQGAHVAVVVGSR